MSKLLKCDNTKCRQSYDIKNPPIYRGANIREGLKIIIRPDIDDHSLIREGDLCLDCRKKLSTGLQSLCQEFGLAPVTSDG